MTTPHILIKPDIFETSNKKYLTCIHGYTNYVAQNELITWVSKTSWKMFLFDFPQALEINPCPSTNICNTCKEINVAGDILNVGGNVEHQEDNGFV